MLKISNRRTIWIFVLILTSLLFVIFVLVFMVKPTDYSREHPSMRTGNSDMIPRTTESKIESGYTDRSKIRLMVRSFLPRGNIEYSTHSFYIYLYFQIMELVLCQHAQLQLKPY